MDLTAASDSDGEPGAKQQQRYSPHRSDRPLPAAAALGTCMITRSRGAAVPTPMSGLTSVSTQATTIATPRPPSCPTSTGGTSTTPGLPWRTIPTLCRPRAPSRPTPLPAVLRTSSEGPIEQEPAERNEDFPNAVSRLRLSHHVGVPRLTDLHLGAYTPSSSPPENGAWCRCVLRTQPSSSRLHAPSICACTRHRGYTTTGRAEERTHGPVTLCRLRVPYTAYSCVDLTGYSSVASPCRPCPLSYRNTTMSSSHRFLHNRVSIAGAGLTSASLLVLAATYQPRHLRKWVRGLPRALPAAVARKVHQHPPPPPTPHGR